MSAKPSSAGGDRRQAIEVRIVDVATSQHGVITREQLTRAGLSPSAVRRRVESGRLTPLHRGVYGVGPFLPPLSRSMAAVLACAPDALLSHRAAAAHWGLLSSDDRWPIDITVPRTAFRTHSGIRLHRKRLDDDERITRHSLPMTSALRTLLDLASCTDSRDLERAVAQAEREQLVTTEDLASMVDRYRGYRAIRRLRAIIDRAGGPSLTRSEAERRFLSLVRRARLPAPRTNVRLGEFEVDFFWPDHDLAVEVDGYRYHGSRVRFESDRERGVRLAAIGVQIVPLTWRQIVEEELATAALLGQTLAQARLGKAPLPGRTEP